MLSIDRENQILDLLKSNKSVIVSELAKMFFVSEATIRRDLSKINKQKIIKRTYGGAILLDALSHTLPLNIRERENSAEKNIIGKLAAGFVNDFDIIIIDSSSTSLTMIKYLTGKHDLTIITNGVKTASMIGQTLSCNFLCTGGASYDKTLSLVGHNAEAFMRKHNAKKLFFSCKAISQNGFISNLTVEESVLKNVMIEQSEEVYLLADHTKLGTAALSNICTFQDIDFFITDCKPPDHWIKLFDNYQITVIYPEQKKTFD
ncbi:MAG: DeoR/GlpR family DNA-binding transcription regulator [Eubacteriales bacterium]|nr:DeoR/GlpR family DNA-binding transcription regulator [Eubacteriales bacterium]